MSRASEFLRATISCSYARSISLSLEYSTAQSPSSERPKASMSSRSFLNAAGSILLRTVTVFTSPSMIAVIDAAFQVLAGGIPPEFAGMSLNPASSNFLIRLFSASSEIGVSVVLRTCRPCVMSSIATVRKRALSSVISYLKILFVVASVLV